MTLIYQWVSQYVDTGETSEVSNNMWQQLLFYYKKYKKQFK